MAALVGGCLLKAAQTDGLGVARFHVHCRRTVPCHAIGRKARSINDQGGSPSAMTRMPCKRTSEGASVDGDHATMPLNQLVQAAITPPHSLIPWSSLS